MANGKQTDAGKILGTLWWIILIRGTALLLLGVLALIRPGVTLIVFIQFVGFFWLIDGVALIFRSIKERKVLQGWGWGLFGGILSVISAIIILGYPIVSTLAFSGFIVYLVAFGAIFSGISSIISGISLRKEVKNFWSTILGGLFTFILGGLLLSVEPILTVAWFTMIVGILGIAVGIFLIIESFKVRKLSKIAG